MAERVESNPISNDAAGKKNVAIPSPDDFKGSAVTKAVLKQSIQEPATIYPLVGSALAITWTLLIAPTPASVAVVLGLGFVGASSFIYHYVVKGPERAEAYVNGLREARRASQARSLETIAEQCREIGLQEGAKEARELKAAYEQLMDYLKNTSKLDAVDRFSILAEDSLRQGVRTLEQAIAVHTAMTSIDLQALQQDRAHCQKRLRGLDEDSTEYRAIKQQMDSHNKRIALWQQSEQKLAELIAESNEIETALQTTYLELVDFGNQNLDDFLRADGGAVNRLVGAVEAARRVEQKLRGEDPEGDARRNKYIQLAEENEEPPK